MATKLKELEIEEGSLVDKGANPLAHVVLFKRDKSKSLVERVKDFVKGAMTFDQVRDSQDARREWWELTDAFSTSVRSIIDENPDNAVELMMQSAVQFVEAVKPLIPQLEGTDVYLRAQGVVTAVEAAMEGETDIAKKLSDAIQEPDGTGSPEGKEVEKMTLDEILKGLPEEQRKVIQAELDKKEESVEKEDPVEKKEDLPEDVRKRIEETEKRNTELEKRLNEQIEKAEIAEFVAKAKTYPNLPNMKPDEFGPVLRKLSKVEGYDKLEAILEATNKALEDSELMKVKGEDGGDASDAYSQLEKKAEELQKADSKLTKEQAFNKACEANPDLYAEYKAER